MISSEVHPSSSLDSRQECLRLLGLKQWYCRYHLPKAAKTPDSLLLKQMPAIALDQQVAGHDVSSNAIAELASTVSAVQTQVPGHASGQQLNSASIPESEPAALLAIDASKQLLGQAIELPLSMMTTDDTVIFYERQHGANEASETALLQSFLKFAVSSQQTVYDLDFLEWPVFSSQALELEQAVYFGSVFSRWALAADWKKLRYVFYFGYYFDELESHLLEIKIEKESECVFVPIRITLAELLGAPIKKRGLWESVSSLSGNE